MIAMPRLYWIRNNFMNGPTSPNSDQKIAENGTSQWADIGSEGAKLFHAQYYCPKKVMLA